MAQTELPDLTPTHVPTRVPVAAEMYAAQPPADPTLVKAVDRWRATGDILQRDRNDLRNIVFNAVHARLGFQDGFGGDSLWGNDKALAPRFEATSVELNQSNLARALLPIDQSNDDDVRALRALAWAHHKGSWVEVPEGERLQRLAEIRLAHWVTTVREALLPPERSADDHELIRLVDGLLTVARALGIADAFKPDTASKVRALFAPAPPRPDLAARPALLALHSFLLDATAAGSNMNRVGRGQLQQRLLRHASYSQGGGQPLALDLSKITKVVRGGAAGAPWPESTPDVIKTFVATVEARLASLDALRLEASNLVPDVSDIGGDVTEVASELLVLVNERAAAGALPGGIDLVDLLAASTAVKPGDQRKVEAAFAELSRWNELSMDEKLQVLNGGWDEPARRVNAWLRLARQTVQRLKNSLGNADASDVQREYAGARDHLIGHLIAMADTVAASPAPGPKGMA